MENPREGNIEPVARTYKSAMIPYIANSYRQDVCLFERQCTHQLLLFKALQQ